MDVLAGLRYEEAIDDWLNITSVDPSKQGPLLKSRLNGDALLHRELLDKDQQKDPTEGVTRPHSGCVCSCLFRLLCFFNHTRHNSEFLRFISKFEMLLRRLKAAWTDLMPEVTAESPQFLQAVQELNARHAAQALGLPPSNDPDTSSLCRAVRHLLIPTRILPSCRKQ